MEGHRTPKRRGPLRIVYATDNYHPRVSGMAISIDRFKKFLEKRGHEVHVFAPRYIRNHSDPDRVHRFDSLRLLFSKEDRLVAPWAKRVVFRTLEGIDPHIIHVQTEFGMGSLTKAYALKEGIPLVMTAHTHWEQYVGHYFPWVPGSLSKWAVRRMMVHFYRDADLMICPTPQMKEVLKSYGIDKEIHVVPTGIDPDEFAGADKAMAKEGSPLFVKWPELKGKRIIAYLGRVGLEKNVDLLIPVLMGVMKRCPEAHLLVTGDGPYLSEMRAEANRRGLSDHVTFTGYGGRDMVREVLTIADIFALPSLTETQGLVTCEAMACGTPVVAIGAMGTKYVMGGDNGGFMVPNDKEAFTDSVLKLLRDPDLWRTKSAEALEHSRKWGMPMLAERMETLYKSVI
jgi:glycosyltransferase involved in cell wall biosynthesis